MSKSNQFRPEGAKSGSVEGWTFLHDAVWQAVTEAKGERAERV